MPPIKAKNSQKRREGDKQAQPQQSPVLRSAPSSYDALWSRKKNAEQGGAEKMPSVRF